MPKKCATTDSARVLFFAPLDVSSGGFQKLARVGDRDRAAPERRPRRFPPRAARPSGDARVMDHDVAAWVTEEAERGTLSARGEARSQIPTRSTADRFGVPPTPFTPPPRVDDHPGGLGTDMFLRRVRDTAARGPGASALGGGGVPGTGAKSPMPMPSAIRHPSRSPPSAPEPRTRRNRSSTTTRRARGARSARSRASSRTSAPVPSPRRRRRRRLRASAASAPPSCAPPPPTRRARPPRRSSCARRTTWTPRRPRGRSRGSYWARAPRRSARAPPLRRARATPSRGGSARAATRRRGSPAALRIPTRSPRPSPRACAWPRGTKRATR